MWKLFAALVDRVGKQQQKKILINHLILTQITTHFVYCCWQNLSTESETIILRKMNKSEEVISILVVDDDTTCLSIISAILRRWNYEGIHNIVLGYPFLNLRFPLTFVDQDFACTFSCLFSRDNYPSFYSFFLSLYYHNKKIQ